MKNLFLLAVISMITFAQSIAQLPDFEFHYIEKDAYWITSAQQTTLSDIDNDGDLDFTTGNVHKNPSLFWYEYISVDTWIKHIIGSDDGFYGGAVSIDVNLDGRTDIISSEYLFVNKKGISWPKDIGWDKYYVGTGDIYCHDLVKADLNMDGKIDIISNSGAKEGEGLCWYEVADDPTKPWKKHEIGGEGYFIHAGVNPWPVGDIDGDGDMDIVQAECDLKDTPAGLGWLENADGKGSFNLHWIKPREANDDFHSMFVFDYDNDGDMDIMAGNGPLSKDKKTFIYENLAGPDKKPISSDWREHVILEGFVAHDGVVGDVDGDGDIDIVSKEWTSGSVYYLENKLKK